MLILPYYHWRLVTIQPYVKRHAGETLCIMLITASSGGSTTLLAPMLREQGKDPLAIGALVGVPAVMALLIRVPGGLLYSRERMRILLVGALSLSALAYVLYPLTPNPGLLVLIGAVYGTGFSISTTVNLASTVDSIGPHEHRGKVMAMYAAGMSFGYAIGGFSSGSAGDAFGYRRAFVLMALICLLGMVPAVAPIEFPAADEAPRPRSSAFRRAQNLGVVLMDPVVTFMVLGAFFLNVFLTQFNTFMPLTLLPLGLTLAEVGFLRGLWSLTNAFGRPFAGAVLSLMDNRRTQNLTLALQAGLLMLFALTLPFALYLPIIVTAAFCRAVCYVANTVVLAEIDPAKVSRGVAS